jgi:hypothetical protein
VSRIQERIAEITETFNENEVNPDNEHQQQQEECRVRD